MQKPIYAAFASPKGGVGKTTLTILAASNLHYTGDLRVVVIDCNYPLYPIDSFRQNEVAAIQENPSLGRKIMRQFRGIDRKVYQIVNSRVETALQSAQEICEQENKIDLILFDLPPLMAVDGTSELLSAMDLVIFPVTGSRMVAEITKQYIELMNEQVITIGRGNLKSICLIRNQISHWEWTESCKLCTALEDATGATRLDVMIPYTKHINVDMFNSFYYIAVSTLLATDNCYHTLHIKDLIREIRKITKGICGKS